MAQGGRQVIQAGLFHQLTDAAAGEASLVAAAVRVFIIAHVPRIGIPVGGLQLFGLFHALNIRGRKLLFSTFAAEPPHRRRHHGRGVVVRQRLHVRPLRHGQDKRAQHGAVDDVHLEAVLALERRQVPDQSAVSGCRLPRDCLCRRVLHAEHGLQMRPERGREQRPHAHGHSNVVHRSFPLLCIS